MKIGGIICEFNPFHKGHKYIIDKIRQECDLVIAVMSGNYVQRGEPAFCTKFQRTRSALVNGVDLVIELPSPWSASFAENFAIGGVSILKECGIDTLYFGSESGDLQFLEKIAETDLTVKPQQLDGETYSKARERTLGEVLGQDAARILQGANDNLGIEYLKAAKRLECDFEMKCITRTGVGHDDGKTEGEICSASYIREHFSEDGIFRFIPESICNDFVRLRNFGEYADYGKFGNAVITHLRRIDDFSRLSDISEGLDKKLLKEVKFAASYEKLCEAVKSKRYTAARVRRLILSAFLAMDNTWTKRAVPYLNILGFSSGGEAIIKEIGKKSELPLIFSGKPSKTLDKESEILLNKEWMRNDVYASLLENPLPCRLDRTQGLIKI